MFIYYYIQIQHFCPHSKKFFYILIIYISFTSADIKSFTTYIATIEWTIANANGAPKYIKVCINIDLFIILSVTPIFLRALYLFILSLASDNCWRAKTAALAIKNTIPKYFDKYITIADNPKLCS